MKPRISLITLAVDDLERAVGFYRDGLGLASEGIVGQDVENGAVAFFDLQPHLKPAQDTAWGGYAGYFQDPGGHLWEVAWNPAWALPD